MPATKGQLQSTNAAAAADGAGVEVLTLPEVAAYLRLSEEDTLRLVRSQELPGRQVGKEWRFLKAAIQEWLRVPQSLRQQKDVMSWAGAFQDDPDLKEIVREAYAQRGRSMTEDRE